MCRWIRNQKGLYKEYRQLRKKDLVKKGTFFFDFDLSIPWLKYKIYRLFKK